MSSKKQKLLLTLAIAFGGLFLSNSAAEASSWQSVTYGNGLYVAVSYNGIKGVVTSPDGITWTSRVVALDSGWYSVAYGNSLFVAVSMNGHVMTSPDGITWTAQSAAESYEWTSVTYGNSLFVAVSRNGISQVMTSPDGVTWTAQSASEYSAWSSVTYGNSLFVAVSQNSHVMTSSDGVAWTSQSAAEVNSWRSVTYGNGLFVVVSDSGTNQIMTSPDGITWTSHSASEVNNWRSVTYGNSLFVAVSDNGTNQIMISPDGATWTAQSAVAANQWTSVTYGNSLFVAVSQSGTDQAMTSTDGITWTAQNMAQVPDAPVNLYNYTGPDYIRSHWSAQNNEGAITTYMCEHSLSGQNNWSDCDVTSSGVVTINDIIPETAYDVRVAAVNAVGQGPFSDTLSFTTDAAGPEAVDVIGQVDVDGNPDFYSTEWGLNAFNFSNQSSIALDQNHHRLFVADGSSNSRVLAFNLNADNTPIDYEADFVIGQADMVSTAGGLSENQVDTARNVFYDNKYDRLFVADTRNNRVLVFDGDNIATNMVASYVLGQPDFDTNTYGTDQNSFWMPMGMDMDESGDWLYVAETMNNSLTQGNNRVMVFDVRPAGSAPRTRCEGAGTIGIANGMNASCVIGQPDFVTRTHELDQNSFYNGPRDVAYDSVNEVLYVAAAEDYRVLAFDVRNAETDYADKTMCGYVSNGLTSGLNASCVLGQPDFTSQDYGGWGGQSQNAMANARGLWFDSVNDRLFVTDHGNGRVLRFDNMTNISNFMNASAVYGVPDFDTENSDGWGRYLFGYPNAVLFDEINNRLYISDNDWSRILVFNLGSSEEEIIPEEIITESSSIDTNSKSYKLYQKYKKYRGTVNKTKYKEVKNLKKNNYTLYLSLKKTYWKYKYLNKTEFNNLPQETQDNFNKYKKYRYYKKYQTYKKKVFGD